MDSCKAEYENLEAFQNPFWLTICTCGLSLPLTFSVDDNLCFPQIINACRKDNVYPDAFETLQTNLFINMTTLYCTVLGI